ncbi:sulfotransferase family 2 domain-containing protein [Meridianimaribacter flavus]|uniref:Sulfotransferase family protein n=1 Tax=Meridianimaribacter flavus TaxID=571115 RepID=A0ABY2G8J4_9FLAO|nr:sulfotransferase family 2 domain-containing protein [Meridianimaribacter flavus]TDY13588.1 sulfotransferase family protein [Meridianimaribacter flavus]
MGKLSFFEKIFLKLPHSLIYNLYRFFRSKEFNKKQEERKIIVKGKEKYSLKGFDDNECIFIHIPKAGGVSLALNLFGNLGYGHRPIYKYLYIFNQKEFKKYFKFTFARNPWDRLVSAYFFLKAGGFHKEDAEWYEMHLSKYKDFEDFVLNWVNEDNIYKGIHFIPQYEFITINSKVAVDKIYKIEEFNNSVKEINEVLNKDILLTHENKSKREKDYRTYYSSKTQKIVEEVYKKDILLFGYSFSDTSHKSEI